MTHVLQAGADAGGNGNRKYENRNNYPQGSRDALSGSKRIHGQCSHQEVVFNMALVSAVICMQV